MSKNAITDLHIQDTTTKGPHPVPGWVFLPTDLNKGVGGDFLYLGIKRGGLVPVTNLDFRSYEHSRQGNPMPDWEWSPIDLNRGAGGQFVYMFYKKGDPGSSPITGIMFLPTDQSKPYQIAGWQHTGVDLNKGAGGLFIWAYYSRSIVSP